MWGWAAERFEAMFANHIVRRHREFFRAHRDRMVAAIYGNPNYDGEEAKASREATLETIYEQYDKVVDILFNDAKPDDPLPADDFLDDPLFRPIAQQMLREQQPIAIPDAGAGAAILR